MLARRDYEMLPARLGAQANCLPFGGSQGKYKATVTTIPQTTPVQALGPRDC